MGAITKKKAKRTLSPKQMKALVALTSGQSHKKAAELAGVSEATISNWMRTNLFHKEFTKAMERMRYAFEARVVAAGQDAIAVIHKELDNPDVEIRLKAGTSLANNAVRIGSRYKELEVSGALPAQQPMIIFPQDTKMPWNSKPVEVVVDAKAVVVDAKAKELPSGSEDDETSGD